MISLENVAMKLNGAQNIVITAHTNPDGDAVGSSLAMKHALESVGKRAKVVIDDKLPRHLSCLPDFDTIIRPPQTTEKIPCDIFLVLDTAPDRIGDTQKSFEGEMLNIDHHITNKGNPSYTYVDAKRAATAEIIYELLDVMQIPLTKKIASCLYLGMATDTGFFKFANTTAFTMNAVANCLEAGVKPNEIAEFTEQKSYETVKTMAEAMNTLELFADGRAAGIFLNEELTKKAETTEGFIDQIRIIEGVDIAVLLKCNNARECRVSMRSKGANVAKIAESFGGGGHIRAAGATLNMGFYEAKSAIMAAITFALKG